jgi:hypothetical protein
MRLAAPAHAAAFAVAPERPPLMQLADYPGVVFILMLVLLPLAAELGYRISRRSEVSERAAGLSSATLGLLALLVGFTFAMAADRYDLRRQLSVDEANAIGTTYIRYQLLEDSDRNRLEREMGDYVRIRLTFDAAGGDVAKLKRNLALTQASHQRIWAELKAALATPEGKQFTVPLLNTTNEMFDLAEARDAAIDARVPRGIRVSLVVFAIIAAGSVGWGLGAEWRRRPGAALTMLGLTAFAIGLIADLDQPGAGIVKPSQHAMQVAAAPILKENPGR